VSAEDPDLGVNKAVTYDFGNPSQVQGLYIINRDTGEIFTNAPLTGKGRREPYVVSVRYKHRVGRVLSFSSSRRNWDLGLGKVPIPTKGYTLLYSVNNIRTLWV
jgi:hypothetical protein